MNKNDTNEKFHIEYIEKFALPNCCSWYSKKKFKNVKFME